VRAPPLEPRSQVSHGRQPQLRNVCLRRTRSARHAGVLVEDDVTFGASVQGPTVGVVTVVARTLLAERGASKCGMSGSSRQGVCHMRVDDQNDAAAATTVPQSDHQRLKFSGCYRGAALRRCPLVRG